MQVESYKSGIWYQESQKNQIRPPTIVRFLSIAFQADGQTASPGIFLVKGKVIFM